MKTTKLRFTKWDGFAIAGILLLAILVFVLFLPKAEPAAYGEVYLDGRLVETLSLQEDREITVSGKYSNTVAVREGKIAVIRSDCPGEDCVSCGWIARSGRSIVCLPNGLEIRVVAEHNDVDFVVR